jgi:hypothetical protein
MGMGRIYSATHFTIIVADNDTEYELADVYTTHRTPTTVDPGWEA